MPGFRFHDLRHTFRTRGAEAGVPLEVMMAQLGHMDRETSLEYVHIQQRALERAKELMEFEQEEVLATAEGRPVRPKKSSEANPRRARARMRSAPILHPSRRSQMQSRRAVLGASPASRKSGRALNASRTLTSEISTNDGQNRQADLQRQSSVPDGSSTGRS